MEAALEALPAGGRNTPYVMEHILAVLRIEISGACSGRDLQVQYRQIKEATFQLGHCVIAIGHERRGPNQIAAARRHYEQWWLVLEWVRDGLREDGMLRDIDVTDAMPKREPWR